MHRSRRAFMSWALKMILNDQDHPLRFLVSIKEDIHGNVIYDRNGKHKLHWNEITRITKGGKKIRGRYPVPDMIEASKRSDDRKKFIVQAGHMLARVSQGTERFMLEDVDLNILGGQTIESKGAISAKQAVSIGGIPVDFQTAKHFASAGLLGVNEKGTIVQVNGRELHLATTKDISNMVKIAPPTSLCEYLY